MHLAMVHGLEEVGRVGFGGERAGEGDLAGVDGAAGAGRVRVAAITRSVGERMVTVSWLHERRPGKGIAELRRNAAQRGGRAPLSVETIQELVHQTLREKPAAGNHLSIRDKVAATDLSRTRVQRMSEAHELTHVVKTFPKRGERRVIEKLENITLLHPDLGNEVLVFSVDQKSRIFGCSTALGTV